ncbi:MAG: PilZ domain-containing protein [Candidatus Omnitrophica bacterium]|nr:PilZ domain-containing protein [Candidatus Omnitrophota bacterium]
MINERRKHPRYNIDKLFRATQKGGDPYLVRTINVSMGGFAFWISEPLIPETTVTLNLPLDGESCNINARVVYCLHNTEKNLYRVGVEFSETTHEFKKKLANEILTTIGFRSNLSHIVDRAITDINIPRALAAKQRERLGHFFDYAD